MSQHATELCLLLVDDIYGELTSRVFEALLCYGRLSMPTLLRHTGLTTRQVSNSLVVLVQQHLALWYTSREDYTTYYEADWTSTYALIRSGKYIKITEDHYGEFAGGVISNLLLLGHARVDDLAQAYNVSRSKEPTNQSDDAPNGHLSNGIAKTQVKSHKPNLESLHSTLYTLLEAGYICKVHESHIRPRADNRAEAEQSVQRIARFQGPLKGKMKDEYEEAVQQKLEDWRDMKDAEVKPTNGLSNGRKRRLEDSESSNGEKRTRLENGAVDRVNGHAYTSENYGLYLDNNLVLKVNHEKFGVAARNKRLVELAEEAVGKTSSKVYAELLKRLEKNLRRCHHRSAVSIDSDDDDDPEDGQHVSAEELATAFVDSTDLAGGIGYADPSKIDVERFIHPKQRRRKDEAEDDGDTSTDEDDDMIDSNQNGTVSGAEEDHDLINGDAGDRSEVKVLKEKQPPTISDHQAKLNLIRDHLLLLAEHQYAFVDRIHSNHTRVEKWAVNFSALSRQLRLLELERTIFTRYGDEALRVIRILQEKGKLDEKAVTNIGLINQKVIRAILTTMHKSGHLELQEIPRDNHRQPSRTMYFWFFDPERCRQKVLEETYKAMARCMQRVKVEKERVQVTIDKAARTDVVGKEDEYLGVDERKTLKGWREMEERILGELGRLDDLVAVLRDF